MPVKKRPQEKGVVGLHCLVGLFKRNNELPPQIGMTEPEFRDDEPKGKKIIRDGTVLLRKELLLREYLCFLLFT
jgi:hypothetical protein